MLGAQAQCAGRRALPVGPWCGGRRAWRRRAAGREQQVCSGVAGPRGDLGLQGSGRAGRHRRGAEGLGAVGVGSVALGMLWVWRGWSAAGHWILGLWGWMQWG